MVVSIGWFQTFTWEMVVFTIHPLNTGCLRFRDFRGTMVTMSIQTGMTILLSWLETSAVGSFVPHPRRWLLSSYLPCPEAQKPGQHRIFRLMLDQFRFLSFLLYGRNFPPPWIYGKTECRSYCHQQCILWIIWIYIPFFVLISHPSSWVNDSSVARRVRGFTVLGIPWWTCWFLSMFVDRKQSRVKRLAVCKRKSHKCWFFGCNMIYPAKINMSSEIGPFSKGM